MERYVGGVAVIGIGIAFLAGVPLRWWPGMPSTLVRCSLLAGALLFIGGTQLTVIGACQELNVPWCQGVVDVWDYIAQPRVMLWISGGAVVLLLAYTQLVSDRSIEQMRLVRQELAYLDPESKDWLRQLLLDERPLVIPYRIGQALERTGFVARDREGKGSILEEYRPTIEAWLQKESGGNKNLAAALLIAAGICFFITGAVLYSTRTLVPSAANASTADASPEGEHLPSMIVLYQDKRFQIRNTGSTSLSLWGTKLSDTGQKVLERQPQYIAPGASYSILAEHIDRELIEKIADGNEARMRFQVYLVEQSGHEVTMDFILLIRVQDRTVSIRSQVLGAFDGW